VNDVLRRLTLVALALSLLFAQAAGAKNTPPGNGNHPGEAGQNDRGFSDGR
jgi:hypothetical protein